jgi:hypothetical protein
LTDENFEAEIFCFNLGEVIAAREAIQKLLTLTEYEVITLYGQGFTLEEIAVKIGLDHPEKVKRILFRSRGKVDSLKMEVMYDSKIAAYQGKQGKADIKYKDTIYNEKTDTYKEVKHIPSEVINRKFICLDQSKVKKQLLPENYSGDMCPCRKEVITEIASDTDSKKYEAKILNGQYMESNLGPFTSNKEVIQLYFNRHEYSQMLRSEMTVIKEKRYAIEFQTGRYISTDHKFKNLPA